jgi:hypothetical protein
MIRGEGQVCGVRGNAWLAFTPEPTERLNLAGLWTPSPDALHWGESISVPGTVAKLQLVRRLVRLPEAWCASGGQTYLYLRGGYAITGAIVNGRYLRRHHDALGEVSLLNLTPLLRFDADNEIAVVLGGGRDDRIDDVHLRLYPAGTDVR